MPSATPTSPSPGPDYHWDSMTGQWVKWATNAAQSSTPTSPPPGSGTHWDPAQQKMVPDYYWDSAQGKWIQSAGGFSTAGYDPSRNPGPTSSPSAGSVTNSNTTTAEAPPNVGAAVQAQPATGSNGWAQGGGTLTAQPPPPPPPPPGSPAAPAATWTGGAPPPGAKATDQIAPVPLSKQTPVGPTSAWTTNPDGTVSRPTGVGPTGWGATPAPPPGGGTSATDKTASDAAAAQKKLADQLTSAAGNAVSRPAPQVTGGANVVSDVATAEKPTASLAGPTQQITAPTITDTTIAPIERYGAATIAPTAAATAGHVQAATIDTNPQAQFRQGETDLVKQLQDAAAGNAPSAAQIQGRQQADEAVAQQLGVVGMNHGRGANAALRTAGRNIGQIQAKAAGDAAALRANEMANARSQLSTALGQGREQDIGLATKAADLTQGANTTNAQLTTTTNISNADRDAARNMKQADLEQAAAAGNAAAQNELQERQAALTEQTKTTNAANTLETAKSNQGTDLATQLKNAELATNTSIVGAEESNKVGLANAENDLKSQLANQDNATKVALANAGFTLEGRKIDDAANVDAINAALKGQQQLASTVQEQQRYQLARDQFNQAIKQGNRALAMQILGSILGAGSQLGAAALSHPSTGSGSGISIGGGGGSGSDAPDSGGSDSSDTYDTSYVDSLPVDDSSDARVKRNVAEVSDEAVSRLARALGPVKSWRYEGARDDGREHFGHMAQALEKDPLGKKLVGRSSDGTKKVDYQGLTQLLLAAALRGRKEARRP